MEIHTCAQGSPEWFAVRAGIPTASEFSTVMASGKGGGESKTRKTYMLKLAGERLTGKPMENFSGGAMKRGKELEAEARDLYAFLTDAEPEQVGFITNGPMGCSPDSLLSTNGLLEIKTEAPHLLIGSLDRNDFPPDHKAQCQGQLMVAEREWLDLAIYYPGLPLITHRTYRDESYIAAMRREIDVFNAELDALVHRVRAQGQIVRKAA
jgi:hypothetical protein